MKSKPFYNQSGKILVTPELKKQAMGLYGNIYAYPNYGKYRPRYYSLSDTNNGLDTMSRELLVRWSREMFGQLPIVSSGVKALANFSIGNAYLPLYTGKKMDWWKEACSWLINDWYPNCSVKGPHFDFQTSLRTESQLLDVDGDYLLVFGSENDFPKFQVIQNNRLVSTYADNTVIQDGPMKGCIISDGIYYSPAGKVMGYHIKNATNLVNMMSLKTEDSVFSAKDASLILDPLYIDKVRGIPVIGSAILQALSIQQLDELLMEKIKIQAKVALIKKTPSGEAPVELQNTLQELLRQEGQANGNLGAISPNLHAVEVVQGSTISYVSAEGGEIKSLDGNAPGNETADYMERLEEQVLSTIGVPHALLYSYDKVGGRITSAVAELFRSAITRRQNIIDKTAKFRVSWALIKAMDYGYIPRNDDEVISRVIEFTHPTKFSLDQKYDNDIITNNYQNGFSSLNEATTQLYNKSAEDILNAQTAEQIMFYKRAKEVADATGVSLEMVVSGWRRDQKITRPPEAMDSDPASPDSNATN